MHTQLWEVSQAVTWMGSLTGCHMNGKSHKLSHEWQAARRNSKHMMVCNSCYMSGAMIEHTASDQHGHIELLHELHCLCMLPDGQVEIP